MTIVHFYYTLLGVYNILCPPHHHHINDADNKLDHTNGLVQRGGFNDIWMSFQPPWKGLEIMKSRCHFKCRIFYVTFKHGGLNDISNMSFQHTYKCTIILVF